MFTPAPPKPTVSPPQITATARMLLGVLASHDAAPAALATTAPSGPPATATPSAPPATAAPSAPPTTAAPLVPLTPPPVSLPFAPVLPESRPPVQPPPKKAPSKKAPSKKAPSKKAPSKKVPSKKKTSTAKAAEKEASAAAAQKAEAVVDGAKKKRGRPPKRPLKDIGNTDVAVDAPSGVPSDAATIVNPTHVFSSTNNNRARARAAAAADQLAADKAAADAVAKEAAKGWTETTVDGATVVTVTGGSKRFRKPAKLPDGSAVPPSQPKVTRKKLDASEAALLARAKTTTAKKRKAPERPVPGKKRKV
ncbi:hypothetical protein K438DRAFT_1965266 [Mycena galopus ATCC 62051]|nr:hypothetical protein K438DRAFT_1965266 [Mycena galopus ATCC 62051]